MRSGEVVAAAAEVKRGQRSAEGPAERRLLVVVGGCEDEEAVVLQRLPPQTAAATAASHTLPQDAEDLNVESESNEERKEEGSTRRIQNVTRCLEDRTVVDEYDAVIGSRCQAAAAAGGGVANGRGSDDVVLRQVVPS